MMFSKRPGRNGDAGHRTEEAQLPGRAPASAIDFAEFASLGRDECGRHGNSRHTLRAAVSDGLHLAGSRDQANRVDNSRPIARLLRSAMDSQSRYGQVLLATLGPPLHLATEFR